MGSNYESTSIKDVRPQEARCLRLEGGDGSSSCGHQDRISRSDCIDISLERWVRFELLTIRIGKNISGKLKGSNRRKVHRKV